MTIAMKSLGALAYGSFILIQTYILSIDGLLNFQSWQALIKYGSDAISENNQSELKKYIKLGFLLDVASAVLGLLCALLLVKFAGRWFRWDGTTQRLATIYSLFIISHIYGTPIGILRLFNRFSLISVQKIAMSIIKVIVLLFLLINGINLHKYTLAVLAIEVFGNLLLIVFSLYTLRFEGLCGWIRGPVKNSKGFLAFAVWSNLDTTISLPVKEFDKILVAKLISKEALAVYDLFKKISQILSKFVNPIYQAVYPELAKLVADRELKKAIHSFFKIVVIIFLSAIIPVMLFTFFSKTILAYLFNENFVDYWYVLTIYVVIRMMGVSFTALDPLITAMGLIQHRFWITCIANSVYLVIAWFLGSQYGILGITLALGLQSMITIAIKLLIVQKKSCSDYEE
jgi:O-antigen/teichoic acid export membrane protein